jgi:hypothetical protein
MKNLLLKGLAFVCLPLLLMTEINAQVWERIVEVEDREDLPKRDFPEEIESLVYKLDVEDFKSRFYKGVSLQITLPLPDGNFENFLMTYDPVMAPDLAEKFPEILSYEGIAESGMKASVVLGPKGVFAIIRDHYWTYLVERYSLGSDEYYVVFDQMMVPDQPEDRMCGMCDEHTHSDFVLEDLYKQKIDQRSFEPVELRTLRLAIATTGEFSERYGGSVEGVIEELVKHVVQLNVIFVNELSTRFELIANNDRLIKLDPVTDGFTNGNNNALLSEAPAVFIGSLVFPSDYDIGHVFGTGGGGVAFLFSLCSNLNNGQRRSQGVSSFNGNSLVSTGFLKLVAHEMGHQFGANHSFNNCQSGGNANSGTGYEPGSGNTIMSYIGLCGSDNTELEVLTTYNFHALNEMYTNLTTGLASAQTCGSRSSVGNSRPRAIHDYENGFFIPVGTPFRLKGRAEDAESSEEMLTYSWEQANVGPKASLGFPNEFSPLFRVYGPSSSPERVFPRMNKILTNNFNRSEVLPEVSRDLRFRFVVRDNHPGGGAFSTELLSFKSTDQAGPFVVTSSTVGRIFEVGETFEVTWNVANTDKMPVNCQRVNVHLVSNSGEFTPIALGVANNGSMSIEIPDTIGFGFRFAVEAADNIFFNVNQGNFRVEAPTSPRLSVVPQQYFQSVCIPGAFEVPFLTKGLGGFEGEAQIEFLSGLPAGATLSLDKSVIQAGESFTATVDFGDLYYTGFVNLDFSIATSLGDTLIRSVNIEIKSGDFSGLNLLSPEDGIDQLRAAPLFTWNSLENAERYLFSLENLSTGLKLYDLVLQDTFFQTPALLDYNESFVWSVGAVNLCSEQYRVASASFSTDNFNCVVYNASNLPMSIPQNASSVREAVVEVGDSFELADVNVPGFRGILPRMGALTVDLISPDGTEVNLFRNACGSVANWHLTLDDEAPNGFSCPLNDIIARRPMGRLSDFVGKESSGQWTFRFSNNQLGNGGRAEVVAIELCGNVEVVSPILIRNETLPVPTLSYQIISTEYLDVTHPNLGNGDVFIHIVEMPKRGRLELNGKTLTFGEGFAIAELKSNRLYYRHEGALTDVEDSFRFVIRDKNGGFLGTPLFSIAIDPSFTVSNKENKRNSIDFTIFPNPGTDYLFIGAEGEFSTVDLLNISGQVMQTNRFATGSGWQLSVSHLPAGVYWVRVLHKDAMGIKKWIKQ